MLLFFSPLGNSLTLRDVSVIVKSAIENKFVSEPTCDNIRVSDVVEDQNPDCLVVVYSVDDLQSFGKNIIDNVKYNYSSSYQKGSVDDPQTVPL